MTEGRTHLDGDEGLDICSLHLRQVHPSDVRQLVGHPQDALPSLADGLLGLGLGHGNSGLDVGGPLELQPQQRHLKGGRYVALYEIQPWLNQQLAPDVGTATSKSPDW